MDTTNAPAQIQRIQHDLEDGKAVPNSDGWVLIYHIGDLAWRLAGFERDNAALRDRLAAGGVIERAGNDER